MLNNSIIYGIFPVTIGYYVMGYYLYKLKITRKMYRISLLTFILFILIGVLLLRAAIINNLVYDDILRYDYFMVAVSSTCAFIIIKYLSKKKIKNDNIKICIGMIGDSGFGVYLFHLYLIEYLSKTLFFLKICSFSSLAAVLYIDIFVFLFFTILFYYLRKISIIRKFL